MMKRRNRVALLGSMVFAGLLVVGLFGALLWTVRGARADTINVPAGSSIQAAIDSAGEGDIIRVQSGTFTESLVVTKSLTLEGGYDSSFNTRDPRTSVISLTTPGRVIKVEGSGLSVTIDGFEIKGGYADRAPGAGLYVVVDDDSHIDILDNFIHSNETVGAIGTGDLQVSGGGIRLDLTASLARIQGNDVLSNVVRGFGAGIWLMLEQGSDVTMLSNTFQNNQPNKLAAGIGGRVNQSTLEVAGGVVSGNSTTQDGGGIYLELSRGAEALITGTEILANSSGSGSGVYALLDQDSYLQVIGNQLDGNIAGTRGGGIYAELFAESRIDVLRNEIISNHADNSGGGIYIEGEERPTVIIVDNIIARNVVTRSTGAGIHTGLLMSGTFRLNNNRVMTNTNHATGFRAGGGGVYADLSNFMSFEAQNNEIFSNEAKEGGGIYLSAAASVVGAFEYNDVYDNEAHSTNGGGGYFSLADNVTLAFRDNDFHGNRADRYGGLFIEMTNNSHVTGDRLRFSDNSATRSFGGGGIEVNYNSAFTMTEGITVTGNVAQNNKVGGLSFVGVGNSQFFVPNMYVVGNMAQGREAGGIEIGLSGGLNTFIAPRAQILSNTAVLEGGGVWADLDSKGVIDLSDSLFAYNVVTDTADGMGGGFYLDGFKSLAQLDLQNTEFLSNTAGDEGGGAYISAPSEDVYLNLRSAKFISNTARSSDGGGLYVGNSSNRAQIYAEDMTFEFNNAGGNGGGMYLGQMQYGPSIILDRSVFLSNTAVLAGGGLYGDQVRRGSSFRQVGGAFSHNQAGSNGGAIYWGNGALTGSTFQFDYITMTHNVAVGGGGGMYVNGTLANNGAWASLTHNRMLSNTAAGTHGGGIYLSKMATTGSTVYFSHNILQGNRAGENLGGSGGGAHLGDIGDSDVEIIGNRIVGNTATDSGGGLHIGQANKGTLDLSGNEIAQNTIYSNALRHGGGLYLDQIKQGSVITMTENTIVENRATGNGGGCYVRGRGDMDGGVTYIFRQNRVDDNIADQDGGGCYFVEVDENNAIKESALEFIDNTFNHNTAARNYGGVFIARFWNSRLRFWDNQLIGNRAGISGTISTGGDGGGIYFTAIDKGSVVDFRDNDVMSNTAVSNGAAGGAYGGLYADVKEGSLLTIQSSRFESNVAESDYAGVYARLVDNSRFMMARTVVSGNVATHKSGGVSIISLEDRASKYSQYFLERNKIINNVSSGQCGLSIIDVVDNAPPLWGRSTNNVIAGNNCGGVHLENVDFRSTNDTIADNVGAGFSVSGTITSTIYLNNGILWGNTINLTTTEPLTQSRFIKESSYEGAADIFVDAAGRDYHLKPGASAVIDKANDDLAPAIDHDGVPRPVGSHADIGAYEYRVPGVIVGGDGLVTALPGEIVAHTATITNDGTAQDVFDLALSANTWPATLSTAEVTLDAGESISVYVWVEAPLGLSQWVTDTTRIIATSQRNAGNTHSADLETEVGLAPAVSLTPDNSAVAPDNSVQRYQHVLVNEGNGMDTFELTASSSQGWTTQVVSSSVTLAEGDSATIEVIVRPQGAVGLVDTTLVTATSVSDGSVAATARNSTTVGSEEDPAVLSLTPDRAASVIAARQHVYTHTLTNLATQPDTFTLTVVSDTGWPVALSAVTETLAAGTSATVYVTVTAPADSAHQQVDVTTVTATSQRNPRVKDAVSDRTTALRISDLELSTLSPRHVAAATSYNYVHRLTNHSHLTDTVVLTVTSSQGWPVTVSPSTMILAGGAQGEVTVTVSVPLTVTHGDADQTRLTAISGNDGKQISVADMTTARKQSNLDLYPDRTGTAIVGTDKVYEHTLENNSAYTDTVSLAATAPDSNWGVRHPVSITLGAEMSTTVMVTVSVPVNAQTGENFLITLNATSGNDRQVVGAVDLTTAQRPSHLSLSSNNPTGVLAGRQRAYYQHTLTNESAVTDTVALTATSSQGWTVDVGPRTVTLGPGMDATVAVTLSLPADGSNGTMDITTVEARSDNAGGALAAAASNVTTLLNPASIQLRASQALSTEAGSTVVYEHRLVNAGDYEDIFSIEAASDQGWQVHLSRYQARLSPGEGVSITLQVTVPATATAGVVDQTTLSVISTYDRDRQAPVTNIDATHVTGGKIYLPLVLRNP